MSLMKKLTRIFRRDGAGATGRRPITCHEALAVVNEFLDGELENITEAEVTAHFEVCRMCYPHLELEKAFREAMHRATRGERAPPELRAKVKELLARADG